MERVAKVPRLAEGSQSPASCRAIRSAASAAEHPRSGRVSHAPAGGLFPAQEVGAAIVMAAETPGDGGRSRSGQPASSVALAEGKTSWRLECMGSSSGYAADRAMTVGARAPLSGSGWITHGEYLSLETLYRAP